MGHLSGGLDDDPGGAYAISSDGKVIVGAQGLYGSRATRWTQQTGQTDLGKIANEPVFDNVYRYARGVSADGSVIVGDAANRPFRWTQATGIVDLGSVPTRNRIAPDFSSAAAVSPDGSIIVGASHNQAFRWTQATGMVGLGFLTDFHESRAEAISGNGSTIVGWSSGFPFRWTQATGMVQLAGTFDGMSPSNMEAFDVSHDGSVIVGGTGVAASTERAFRWTEAEGFLNLGGGAATGVSADGSVIVGGWLNEGFYWTAATGRQGFAQVLGLNFGVDFTGWDRLIPMDISPDGYTIIGYGRHHVGSVYRQEGFMVTIPEPGSLAVLLAPAAFIVKRRHRQVAAHFQHLQS